MDPFQAIAASLTVLRQANFTGFTVHSPQAWCADANQHGEPALVEAAVGKLIVLQKAVVARVDAVGVRVRRRAHRAVKETRDKQVPALVGVAPGLGDFHLRIRQPSLKAMTACFKGLARAEQDAQHPQAAALRTLVDANRSMRRQSQEMQISLRKFSFSRYLSGFSAIISAIATLSGSG